nr:PREDICTED: translation initiation factor IF-2-like isoform X1 [Lepisosteus oculatus]XP_015195513.1 PREDICTED: translation initiation factor IF-2-like isoform X1 [Lepisosteus oculatus]
MLPWAAARDKQWPGHKRGDWVPSISSQRERVNEVRALCSSPRVTNRDSETPALRPRGRTQASPQGAGTAGRAPRVQDGLVHGVPAGSLCPRLQPGRRGLRHCPDAAEGSLRDRREDLPDAQPNLHPLREPAAGRPAAEAAPVGAGLALRQPVPAAAGQRRARVLRGRGQQLHLLHQQPVGGRPGPGQGGQGGLGWDAVADLALRHVSRPSGQVRLLLRRVQLQVLQVQADGPAAPEHGLPAAPAGPAAAVQLQYQGRVPAPDRHLRHPLRAAGGAGRLAAPHHGHPQLPGHAERPHGLLRQRVPERPAGAAAGAGGRLRLLRPLPGRAGEPRLQDGLLVRLPGAPDGGAGGAAVAPRGPALRGRPALLHGLAPQPDGLPRRRLLRPAPPARAGARAPGAGGAEEGREEPHPGPCPAGGERRCPVLLRGPKPALQLLPPGAGLGPPARDRGAGQRAARRPGGPDGGLREGVVRQQVPADPLCQGEQQPGLERRLRLRRGALGPAAGLRGLGQGRAARRQAGPLHAHPPAGLPLLQLLAGPGRRLLLLLHLHLRPPPDRPQLSHLQAHPLVQRQGMNKPPEASSLCPRVHLFSNRCVQYGFEGQPEPIPAS